MGRVIVVAQMSQAMADESARTFAEAVALLHQARGDPQVIPPPDRNTEEGQALLAAFADMRDTLVWRAISSALCKEKPEVRERLLAFGIPEGELLSQLLNSRRILVEPPTGSRSERHPASAGGTEERSSSEGSGRIPVDEAASSEGGDESFPRLRTRNTFLEFVQEAPSELRRVSSAPELRGESCPVEWMPDGLAEQLSEIRDLAR